MELCKCRDRRTGTLRMKRTTGILILIAGIVIFSGFVVSCCGPLAGVRDRPPVNVTILAINDFHGHLVSGQQLNNRTAGGATILASTLKSRMNSSGSSHTFIALLGDIIGASPRPTALMMDEPSVLFFNEFADSGCPGDTDAESSRCNVIAIPGNHEFNRGTAELLRMVRGGNGTTKIPHVADPYPGSRADYICANVVWKSNDTPVVPPYTIRDVEGISVAFIGAVTTETVGLEFPENIGSVKFLNESDAINRYVTELKGRGVHAFIILLHDGGTQEAYEGPTREGCNVTGPVVSIVSHLDADADVVLAAHTHGFTNAFLKNSGGNDVLVTQSYAYGTAFADVDLQIDPSSGDIIGKSAAIVPVYADPASGTVPDAATESLLADVRRSISSMTTQVITRTQADITRTPNADGDSPLGDLVADSQRAAMGTDIAFTVTGSSAGGLHADLACGNITWADLEAVLPPDASIAAEYGGWYSRPRIAVRDLTGDRIKTILERQWESPVPNETLSVSGLAYTYDPSRSPGSRVTEIQVNGEPINSSTAYTAAMNYYLAYGVGDYAPAWTPGTNVTIGPADIDALIAYLQSLPDPLDVTPDGRIRRAG